MRQVEPEVALTINGKTFRRPLVDLCLYLAEQNFGDILSPEQEREILVSYFIEGKSPYE